MKKYYKLICNFNNKLKSVTSSNADLLYKENEWTFPVIEGSKLFVFNTFEEADAVEYGTEIWECEVQNPSRIKKIMSPKSRYLSDIESFWKYKRNKKKIPYSYILVCPPKGTIICDGVKLVRKVKIKYEKN